MVAPRKDEIHTGLSGRIEALFSWQGSDEPAEARFEVLMESSIDLDVRLAGRIEASFG